MVGFGKFKKCNDLIGARNRDLPVCNIAPESLALLLAPTEIYGSITYYEMSENVPLQEKL
jgi:hypothetical protein